MNPVKSLLPSISDADRTPFVDALLELLQWQSFIFNSLNALLSQPDTILFKLFGRAVNINSLDRGVFNFETIDRKIWSNP